MYEYLLFIKLFQIEEHNVIFLFFILLNSLVFHINSVYKFVDLLFIIIISPLIIIEMMASILRRVICGNKWFYFSVKTGDTFFHVNKSKIAWKILSANQKYLNDG